MILLFRDHSARIEIASSSSETADLSFFWRALIFQAEGKRGRSGLAATGALSHALCAAAQRAVFLAEKSTSSSS